MLGSKRQIELARELGMEQARDKNTDWAKLLHELRNELRREIGLDDVSNLRYFYIRFDANNNRGGF